MEQEIIEKANERAFWVEVSHFVMRLNHTDAQLRVLELMWMLASKEKHVSDLGLCLFQKKS